MIFLGLLFDSGQEGAEPRGMQNNPNQPAFKPRSEPAGGRAEKVEEQQGEGVMVVGGGGQAGERETNGAS